MLRHAQDVLTVADIARVMRLSTGTVRNYITRAIHNDRRAQPPRGRTHRRRQRLALSQRAGLSASGRSRARATTSASAVQQASTSRGVATGPDPRSAVIARW